MSRLSSERPARAAEAAGASAAYRPLALAAEGGRELLPGVHRIESEAGGRPLYQFLLCGERTVLVDTGFATTPAAVLLPYLARIGVDAGQIDMVICTHADTDHHGGTQAMLALAPNLIVTCGDADRALIEDPEVLIERRCEPYREPHGLGYDEDLLQSVRELAPAAPVHIGWTGGEALRIAQGWELRVIATPGHSHGHIAVHDLRHHAVYMGDAVHGAFYPDFEGEPKMPANYVDVDAYLATITALERLDVVSLHGAHWPPQEGKAAVRAFLGDARGEVERTASAVARALRRDQPLSMREIIGRCAAQLGGWSDTDLMYAVEAHLARLERGGDVVRERGEDIDRFRWVGGRGGGAVR